MEDAPAPMARVVGGPRVVSVTADEEKRATIASGADEIAAGSRSGPHGGGWSGPGGRSAGSGIALRKFEGPTGGSEGIMGLLPRGSSAPARRPPAGRGTAGSRASGGASGEVGPVASTIPAVRGGAGDGSPKRTPVGGGGAGGRGLPPKRSSRSILSDDGGDAPGPSGGAGGISPGSHVAAHGRRSAAAASPAVAPDSPPDAVPKAGRRALVRGASAGSAGLRTEGVGPSTKPSRRLAAAGGAGSEEAPDIEPPARTGFTSKPSAALDPQKAASPFGTVKGRTKFATYYNSGRVPVRIDHFGSGKNRIQWDTPIARVNALDLLPVCAEGVREVVHPLSFVARQMFKEMLANPDVARQAVPSLAAIARSLRMAMSDSDCFEAGMEAVTQLSNAVKSALDPHLSDLCSQLAKHSLEGKHRAAVWRTLQTFEENGGADVFMTIKRKVPTYTTVRL